MGGKIEIPTRKVKSILVVQIPQFIFGKRITIQAHQLSNLGRGKDICDNHECDQINAKGGIKFFSRTIDYTNI